jgi:hypothetical protein
VAWEVSTGLAVVVGAQATRRAAVAGSSNPARGRGR